MSRANRIPRVAAGPVDRLAGALLNAMRAVRIWHAKRRVRHLAREREALAVHMLIDALVRDVHTLQNIRTDVIDRRAVEDEQELARLRAEHSRAEQQLQALQTA